MFDTNIVLYKLMALKTVVQMLDKPRQDPNLIHQCVFSISSATSLRSTKEFLKHSHM